MARSDDLCQPMMIRDHRSQRPNLVVTVCDRKSSGPRICADPQRCLTSPSALRTAIPRGAQGGDGDADRRSSGRCEPDHASPPTRLGPSDVRRSPAGTPPEPTNAPLHRVRAGGATAGHEIEPSQVTNPRSRARRMAGHHERTRSGARDPPSDRGCYCSSRTSIRLCSALEARSAHSTAASRSDVSMIQKPPT